MNINLNNNCTGCCACMNICPQNAIVMKEDEYGFIFPYIDKNLCINCGLCQKICKNAIKLQKNMPIETYAMQSKNEDLIMKSSSGGMFAELAKYILSQNGIVFGCTMEKFNDKFEIKHIYIEKEEDLHKLQGSKYVQSYIGNTYKEAKEFLNNGKVVLFSGTPCQIAGLKSYLNKDYENLLCVDLSCTGVPASKMFNDYISLLEKKYNKTITRFDFRNKEKLGWNCGHALIAFKDNNHKIIHNNLSSYLNLFSTGGILRESCYSCHNAKLERTSDITVADCWGIELLKKGLFIDDKNISLKKNKGISLVLVNTTKGAIFLNQINKNIKVKIVDITKLQDYNHPLKHPTIRNQNREIYLTAYANYGYQALENLFYKKLGLNIIYCVIKNYTPEFIKHVIKRIKYRKLEK